MKAIKIALLYWFQQALRLFCPHSNDAESRRYHAPICPTCDLARWTDIRLSHLCGWQAYSQLRKCDLCLEPLADQGRESRTTCASCDRKLASDRAAQEMEFDLPI